MSMVTLRRDDGFALPITIFLVTMLTLMLAALFVRVSADRVVAESSGDLVDAATIAQGGLQSYLGTMTMTKIRPNDGDSTRINVTGGYADVVVRVVQRPADTTANETFVVRSTGYVIKPVMGATPRASRTVVQFAEWQVGVLDALAGFTAANGVQKTGSGTVDVQGYDQCGGATPVAGLRVPTGSTYPSSGIYGSPVVSSGGTPATVAAATGVDWSAVINGRLAPDHTSFQDWNFNYETTVITGDATLSDNGGAGLLVVTGDLTITGSYFYWYGVILVGGHITFQRPDPSNTLYTYIYGSVVSGLQAQLPLGNPSQGNIGANGTYTVIWQCSYYNITGLQNLTGFVPITNAWVENWATY